MKHIKLINELFGKSKEEGDKLVSRVLDIIKKENIDIDHIGGYQACIDENIYVFSDFGGLFSDCRISIYDKSQEIIVGKYKGAILGPPKSKYEISKKMWKKLEELYNDQQHKKNLSDLETNLEMLSDDRRSANKYNL